MLQFDHFSAWIEVDGKELPQYGVEEDLEGNQVSCWIASQAGKNFSIVFNDNSPQIHHILIATPKFDGTTHSGKVLLPTALDRTVRLKEAIISPTAVRPYMFSMLRLTDEDEYLDQPAKHIGEITLSIWRAERGVESRRLAHTRTVTDGKVHERSKKAMSHCVGFGPEMRTSPLFITPYRYPDNKPLTTFVFKYREENLLRANGIIPRPPENSVPPAEATEVVDLTLGAVKSEPHGDDVEALDEAILALQRKRAALQSKRQNPGGSERPAKRIKREGKFVPTGEVIDLT